VTKIYGLVDPQTQELRYVGKTVTSLVKRRDAHFTGVKRAAKITRKVAWLLTLGGARPEVFEIESVGDQNWKESEKFWLAYYRSIGCDLVNESLGGAGGGALGKHWNLSIETRNRMSVARKGKPLSEANKIALRKPHQYKSAESRARSMAGKILLGGTHSPETRRKMSDSQKRYWASDRAASRRQGKK
jgi:hypothetical protein